MGKTYRYDLDLLKGMAIIAVVLYHAGWCKSGYLGVDVFFVINGYLVVPKVLNEIAEGRFGYFRFLEKKIFRLLPSVLLVSLFALSIGYVGMLPNDYRYLSEEVFASSVFMNNMLQAITTQNYWAAIYHKILMHTWFLGVLFQFYIVFLLFVMLFRKWLDKSLLILTILSLLCYLIPIDTIGDKYYLLPYRFFELTIGGLVSLKSFKVSKSYYGYFFLIGLLFMIFCGSFTIGERAMPYNLEGGTNTIRESVMPREVILLLTVLCSILFIITNNQTSKITSFAQKSMLLSPLGKMSLSVFLWHQPLFAFYRYFYADELSFIVLLGILVVVFLLSVFTYYLIEKKIRINIASRICLLLSFIIVSSFALWIYSQGGAVRDVPELNITKGSYDPDVFERYTDRVYQYDHDFLLNNKGKKILIIGNSFARDFANILLESSFADSIQISYHNNFGDCPISRIRQCERIFFFGWKHQVPEIVWQNLRPDAEVWGIGTKNHGTSNGIFFKNRYHEDYYAQRTLINEDFHTVNRLLREEWQAQYVDLLNLSLRPDGTVPIFTPDHYFITYDSRHLTPYGAFFYAKLIVFPQMKHII